MTPESSIPYLGSAGQGGGRVRLVELVRPQRVEHRVEPVRQFSVQVGPCGCGIDYVNIGCTLQTFGFRVAHT